MNHFPTEFTVSFWLAGAVAVAASIGVITALNAVHALLYLVVSLLAVAMVFFTQGAPFGAALEVIIYAGAIMVLFVFAAILLNLGPATVKQERQWRASRIWQGPVVLGGILLGELVYLSLQRPELGLAPVRAISPRQVGMALFGPYALATELASFLLLVGLVGAYHLGFRRGDK